MSRKQRQLSLLAALAVALVWITVRQLQPLFGSEGSALESSVRVASSGASEQPIQDLPEVVELLLSQLEKVGDQYSPGRDPFQFGHDPLRAERRRARRERNEERLPTPPPGPVQVVPVGPQPPPIDVVFLGSFGPQNRRLAVFSDGSEIFNVLEGDVLKKKFVVVKIGYESADVGFVGFPEAPAERLAVGG